MRRTLEVVTASAVYLAAVAVSIVTAARAHHSEAGLDTETLITIEGTIAEYSWRNPHIYFTVATTNERDEQVEWLVQTSPIISAMRRGWTRDSLAVGDRVTVEAHPARDGRPYALLSSIEKEGGVVLGTATRPAGHRPVEPRVAASSSTLEGT
ncbi:MAG: DUF6152 family protein, partial [Rhodothermales bacterium]|nr:DUF6152 family protein [Rhodothermales bacterium]